MTFAEPSSLCDVLYNIWGRKSAWNLKTNKWGRRQLNFHKLGVFTESSRIGSTLTMKMSLTYRRRPRFICGHREMCNEVIGAKRVWLIDCVAVNVRGRGMWVRSFQPVRNCQNVNVAGFKNKSPRAINLDRTMNILPVKRAVAKLQIFKIPFKFCTLFRDTNTIVAKFATVARTCRHIGRDFQPLPNFNTVRKLCHNLVS